jgi:hypothetical protein
MNKKSTIIIILGLLIVIGISFYWVNSIDYRTEQVNLISCAGFSEKLLEYMGYTGEEKQKSCEDLHMAFRGQALDDCAGRIGLISDVGERNYNRLMDSCVYHELASSIGTINAVALIKYQALDN